MFRFYSPSHLHRQGGVWYFRMAVPERLRPLLGRTEVKRSLGTAYIRLARAKAQQVGAAVARFFIMLDATQGGHITMTAAGNNPEKLQAILDRYVSDALEDWEKQKASTPAPFDVAFPADHASILAMYEAKTKDALARNSLRFFEATVDALLTENGITLEKDSPEYRRFAHEVMKREIEATRIGQARAIGDYSDIYATTSLVPGVHPIAQVPQHLQASTVTLKEGIAKYIDVQSRKWRPRSREKFLPIFSEFLELVGDKPLSGLSRDDMREYSRVVHLLPKNRTRAKLYKGKTIKQLLAMTIPETDLLTPATLDDRFTSVSSLLNWLDEEYPGTIHLAQLKRVLEVERKPTTEARRPYTDEELRLLFAPEVYTSRKLDQAWKYWLPLMGLCTGARLGELCQLRLADIKHDEDSGVWFLDINDDEAEGKTLKTAAATRWVPLHPALIELGFLRRVEMLRKRKESLLFPSLLKYANPDQLGKAPSKWFSDFRQTRGVGGGPGEVSPLTFHSLRHSFITRCKLQDLDRRKVKEIVGHAQGEFDDVTAGYEGRFPVKALFDDVVSKLDFSGVLDLERLKLIKWQEMV